MAMSTSQPPPAQNQRITPPLSLVNHPLTPPSSNEKPFTQTHAVIGLFKERQAGTDIKLGPWTEFQLAPGEYDNIVLQLSREEELSGYVNNQIRYDYNTETCRLVVRMPTEVHEYFIEGVKIAIEDQLRKIRQGSDKPAQFAEKIITAGSSRICFPPDNASPSTQSKYEPDASFCHLDTKYPGVIIEVSYSQKRKRAVIGLDIEYGGKSSQTATVSVWRSSLVHTAGGDELQVVQEIADKAFRDEQGNATDHPGLQLQLSDFACPTLTKKEIGLENRAISVSTQQLCQLLATAEHKIRKREQNLLVEDSLPPGVRKRKRSETPLEQLASDDEARYAEQEDRVAQRVEEDDPDYDST